MNFPVSLWRRWPRGGAWVAVPRRADPEDVGGVRKNVRFGPRFPEPRFQPVTRRANRLLTTLPLQRRLNRSGPFAV